MVISKQDAAFEQCSQKPDVECLSSNRRQFLSIGGIAAVAGLATCSLALGATSKAVAADANKFGAATTKGQSTQRTVDTALQAAGISLILTASGHRLSRVEVTADHLAFPMPTVWTERLSHEQSNSPAMKRICELGMDLVAKAGGERQMWS